VKKIEKEMTKKGVQLVNNIKYGELGNRIYFKDLIQIIIKKIIEGFYMKYVENESFARKFNGENYFRNFGINEDFTIAIWTMTINKKSKMKEKQL